MPLAPGTRLGPYEITAPIGKGGMGEVYRAHDTKLERDVAIKVLPDELANDAERVARFEREAKLLASLNHPNIAGIYGLESNALVLELVEGPTLAERIAQGPIPADEAVAIAKQMAVALEAGHEAGIIHRDLKPANVKLKEDGTVKVLDYGLAKALEGDAAGGPDSQLSQSPTLTRQGTLAGVILGTAAYMSPEQAKGKKVDKRTDIFAFGAVLYEMLTAKRAFAGDGVSDTLASVLRSEPDFTALPYETPGSIRRILELCLKKDPKERARDIGDVRLALEGAFTLELEASASESAAATGSTRRALTAVGFGGLVVGAVLAWVLGSRPSTPATVERLSLLTPASRPVWLSWSVPNRILALSPDGTEVVYLAIRTDLEAGPRTAPTSGLVLRSLATREVRDLPGTEGAVQPFFSPDGRWVAFFVEDTGELKKVALSGGNPIMIADGIHGSSWAFGVWLEDGTIVFAEGTGMRRVSSDGGEPTELTTVDTSGGEVAHRWAALVPSSPAVLFTVFAAPGPRIEAVNLDTGERHVVVDNAWGALVLNGEYLLFQRRDTTLVAPFDIRSQTITGPGVSFAEAVQPDDPGRAQPLAEIAAARDGTLAYIPALEDPGSTLGLVGRDGTFEPLGPPPPAQWPRVAPDGHAVAYIEVRGDDSTVRIYDLDRGGTTRVGETGVFRGPAIWQPGGDSLAVGRYDDPRGIFLYGRNGTNRMLVPVPEGYAALRNIASSPDGKALACTLQNGELHDIWVATLGEEPTFEPLLQSPASEFSPAFSPDGNWLAYTSDESGRLEVYVQQYPRGARFQASVDGGEDPVWRRDGKELFFMQVAGPESMMAVSVDVSTTPAGPSLELGKPARLFDLRVTGPNGVLEAFHIGDNTGAGYDVLPDGRFVMARHPDRSTSREIVLVRNWLGELKRAGSAK